MPRIPDDEINEPAQDMCDESQYNFCPLCGFDWDKHNDFHCERIHIKNERPRFYMMDINNYNDDFLKEIIDWQHKYIQFFEKNLGMKKNDS